MYENICGIDGCCEIYEASSQYTLCPKCGISEADIITFETNNPNIINNMKLDIEMRDIYNDALGG